jgi:hypothetical protein
MDYELLICFLAIMIVMAILVSSACVRCIHGYAGNGASERAFLCLALILSITQFVLNFFLAASWDGAPWSERAAVEYGNSSIFVATLFMDLIVFSFSVCGLLCMWLGVIKSSKEKDEKILKGLERRVGFQDEKAGWKAFAGYKDEEILAE